MVFPRQLFWQLAFAESHTDLPEEVHWKSVFPNTPLPTALKDLLPHAGYEKPSIDWSKHNSKAGINLPPRFRAYDYRQSSKGSKSLNAPDSGNPFKFGGDEVVSEGFKADTNNFQDSNKEFKRVKEATNEEIKSVNHDPVHYEKESTNKEFRNVNSDPIHPFIIYEKEATNEEIKGVNHDPVHYEKKGTNKEFRNVNSDQEIKSVNHDPVHYEKEGTNKEFRNVNSDPIHPFIIYGKEATNEEIKSVNHDPVLYEKEGTNKEFRNVNSDPIHPFIIYEKEGTNKEFRGNKNSLGGNHDNAAINETMYFFQEDLHAGKRVKLPLLTKRRDMTTFFPHRVAESIPFSSDKLPEILKHFSFKSESMEANVMTETIRSCEREVIDGEEMYCATSFESFVDSSVSKLGKNIQLLSNELGKETKNPVFTIGRRIKSMGEEELVCHKMEYPYAVFLCHSIDKTAVYRVPLVGIDGTKANALAICHKDTSAWNSKHPAFLSLKVKPGTVPICHFVVRDTLVWVRK
ncbi:hypothetical protein CRYUN_Cryun03dG0120100 [Craigia yunnanensis]